MTDQDRQDEQTDQAGETAGDEIKVGVWVNERVAPGAARANPSGGRVTKIERMTGTRDRSDDVVYFRDPATGNERGVRRRFIEHVPMKDDAVWAAAGDEQGVNVWEALNIAADALDEQGAVRVVDGVPVLDMHALVNRSNRTSALAIQAHNLTIELADLMERYDLDLTGTVRRLAEADRARIHRVEGVRCLDGDECVEPGTVRVYDAQGVGVTLGERVWWRHDTMSESVWRRGVAQQWDWEREVWYVLDTDGFLVTVAPGCANIQSRTGGDPAGSDGETAGLESQIADLHDQIGERDGVIAQLKGELERNAATYGDLYEQASSLEREVKRRADERDEWKRDAKRCEGYMREARAEADRLAGELQLANGYTIDARAKLKAATDEVTSLQAQAARDADTITALHKDRDQERDRAGAWEAATWHALSRVKALEVELERERTDRNSAVWQLERTQRDLAEARKAASAPPPEPKTAHTVPTHPDEIVTFQIVNHKGIHRDMRILSSTARVHRDASEMYPNDRPKLTAWDVAREAWRTIEIEQRRKGDGQ